MSPEQDADIKLIQAQIFELMTSLYMDLGTSMKSKAFGSVEGVAYQISQLAKAHGYVGAAAFQQK